MSWKTGSIPDSGINFPFVSISSSVLRCTQTISAGVSEVISSRMNWPNVNLYNHPPSNSQAKKGIQFPIRLHCPAFNQ